MLFCRLHCPSFGGVLGAASLHVSLWLPHTIERLLSIASSSSLDSSAAKLVDFPEMGSITHQSISTSQLWKGRRCSFFLHGSALAKVQSQICTLHAHKVAQEVERAAWCKQTSLDMCKLESKRAAAIDRKSNHFSAQHHCTMQLGNLLLECCIAGADLFATDFIVSMWQMQKSPFGQALPQRISTTGLVS